MGWCLLHFSLLYVNLLACVSACGFLIYVPITSSLVRGDEFRNREKTGKL